MRYRLKLGLLAICVAALVSCGGGGQSASEPATGQANTIQPGTPSVEAAFTGNYIAETVDISGLWVAGSYPIKEYVEITENGLWVSYSLDVTSVPRAICYQKDSIEIIKYPAHTQADEYVFVGDLNAANEASTIRYINVRPDYLEYTFTGEDESNSFLYPPAYELHAQDLPLCTDTGNSSDAVPTPSDGDYNADTFAIAGQWDASHYPIDKYLLISENGLFTTYVRHNNYAETCFRRYDAAVIKQAGSENEYINVDDLNSTAGWSHSLTIIKQIDSLDYSYSTRQETVRYSYPAADDIVLADLPKC